MAHLMPKVMVPFETRPGETPRKVQIQRCVHGGVFPCGAWRSIHVAHGARRPCAAQPSIHPPCACRIDAPLSSLPSQYAVPHSCAQGDPQFPHIHALRDPEVASYYTLASLCTCSYSCSAHVQTGSGVCLPSRTCAALSRGRPGQAAAARTCRSPRLTLRCLTTPTTRAGCPRSGCRRPPVGAGGGGGGGEGGGGAQNAGECGVLPDIPRRCVGLHIFSTRRKIRLLQVARNKTIFVCL